MEQSIYKAADSFNKKDFSAISTYGTLKAGDSFSKKDFSVISSYGTLKLTSQFNQQFRQAIFEQHETIK